MPELLVLADNAMVAGNYLQAITYLRKILDINRRKRSALLDIIECYLQLGKIKESFEYITRALRYYPNDYTFHHFLGSTYAVAGNLKASAKAYKKGLMLNPTSANTQHMLNAVQQINTPIAPQQYIVNIFDNYSSLFEKELVGKLGYCGHIELPKFMQTSLPTLESNPTILDLGCGTGLLGQELIKYYKPARLVGVDLSSNMLAESQEKAVYTELHKADLIEYLQQNEDVYDVIAATDVLVYVGDLAVVFAAVHARLKPGAYFGFSVEALSQGSFQLRPNGRYQHCLEYIQQLSSNFNFSRIYSKLIDLRRERGKMVPGYLVLLQK